jgi:hypothetical protein
MAVETPFNDYYLDGGWIGADSISIYRRIMGIREKICQERATGEALATLWPRREDSFHRRAPVIKDRGYIFLYLYRVRDSAEKTERKRILHFIGNPRRVPLGNKAVLVVPQLVRTLELQIDKPMRRLPLDNFRRPVDWKDSPAQRVANQSSLANRGGVNAEDAEVQKRRSEFLQIFCFREKAKHFFKRSRNELLGAEDEWGHEGSGRWNLGC